MIEENIAVSKPDNKGIFHVEQQQEDEDGQRLADALNGIIRVLICGKELIGKSENSSQEEVNDLVCTELRKRGVPVVRYTVTGGMCVAHGVVSYREVDQATDTVEIIWNPTAPMRASATEAAKAIKTAGAGSYAGGMKMMMAVTSSLPSVAIGARTTRGHKISQKYYR